MSGPTKMRPSEYIKDPIWFHRQFVVFTQSVTAALLLSRGLHWSRHTADPDQWFYKSREQWTEETGMTRYEQEGARKILRDLGVWGENWEQKTNRLWFRVDRDRLDELLLGGGSVEKPPTPLGVGGKTTKGSGEKPLHLSSTEEDIQKKTYAPAKKYSDTEWIELLQKSEAYRHLNVSAELSRAEIWCQTNARQCTRKFFTNWLNRASLNTKAIAPQARSIEDTSREAVRKADQAEIFRKMTEDTQRRLEELA